VVGGAYGSQIVAGGGQGDLTVCISGIDRDCAIGFRLSDFYACDGLTVIAKSKVKGGCMGR